MGQAGMARVTCSECGCQIPNDAWSCPQCENPTVGTEREQTKNEISSRGMTALLVLFILFPILLFLLHIFVPSL